MFKIMTLVGTRPELIKMSRVIAECDRQFHHILVHSGQNYDYELNKIFFKDLNIRQPNYFLGVHKQTTAKTIAAIIEKSDIVFMQEKPDALLIYGDTNTCLAVIAAKRRKIPIFHMEAGNRCFDQRVPEELNRKVVDHLSDINLVLTEHARRYLILEGIKSELIIKTGSHMHEVINYYMPQIKKASILKKHQLQAGKFFLISIHREENVECLDFIQNLFTLLQIITRRYQLPIFISTHPRTRMRIKGNYSVQFNSNIIFSKPIGFFDYMHLQMKACCVLSDSGTLTEEASLLNLAAIALRYTHERPEGMDAGVLIMASLQSEHIANAIDMAITQRCNFQSQDVLVQDYKNLCVSKQITRIVFSYIDYINRIIWFK